MKTAIAFRFFPSALALAAALAILPTAPAPARADDEDVALPPGMEEDSGDFANGGGGAPANGDSVFHRDIRMGRPNSGGDGCPAGTMSAVLSPDAKTMSLLFDNYVSVAGGSSGARRTIRTCQVAVPFKVPAGMQVQVVKLDYRGFNSIPARGARTRYVMAYFFTDAQTGAHMKRAVRRRAQFKGPLASDYMLSTNIAGPRPPWSGCGKDTNLNIRTRVVAASPSGEETMATIDSVDLVANPTVEYHLRWRPCTNDGSNGREDERPNRPDRPGHPGRPGGPVHPGRPGPGGR